MKRYSTAVAMFLLVSSAVAFAANGNGSGASTGTGVGTDNATVITGAPVAESMGEKMFGHPEIAGDGIQNASQVDSPFDIGNVSSTAIDSPDPVPTVGDVGIQNVQ